MLTEEVKISCPFSVTTTVSDICKQYVLVPFLVSVFKSGKFMLITNEWPASIVRLLDSDIYSKG